MKLVEKLSAIMKEMGAVGKDSTNDFHKYSYMSHAGLMKVLHPLLVKHGVIIHPHQVAVTTAERVTSAKGEESAHVIMRIRYVATDGDSEISVVGVGEGVDKGDKASYKAQTGAHKYALKALFSIPDELDAEGDSNTDVEPKEKKLKYKPSKADQVEQIKNHIRNGDCNQEMRDTWKEDYKLSSTADLDKLEKKDLLAILDDIAAYLNDGGGNGQ